MLVNELPINAKECAIDGVFISEDAKIFRKESDGYKELSVKKDKKSLGKFYNRVTKKYYSVVQAYAEAFVPNPDNKPMAFLKDNNKPLSADNVMWATHDEWIEFWKANVKRYCKCCGETVEEDLIGSLCKNCFDKMINSTSDSDEIKRFQERVAATGFNPDTNRFSGRQKDILELYCSGESLASIASIVGCDLKTASACIKSAKTARVFEKMSCDSVTPIGFKTVADVLPAEMLNQDMSVSKTEVVENTAKEITEESIKQAVSFTVPINDLVSDSPIRKALVSDLYKEPRYVAQKEEESENDSLSVNRICLHGQISAESLITRVNKKKVKRLAKNKKRKSLSDLLELYRCVANKTKFATFCKVYWLALKYTKEQTDHLTILTCLYLSSRFIPDRTKEVHKVLRAGVQVIYGL